MNTQSTSPIADRTVRVVVVLPLLVMMVAIEQHMKGHR